MDEGRSEPRLGSHLTSERAEYWAKIRRWKAREAAALVCGLDPDTEDSEIPQIDSDLRDIVRLILRSDLERLEGDLFSARKLLTFLSSHLEVNSVIAGKVRVSTRRSRYKRMYRDCIDRNKELQNLIFYDVDKSKASHRIIIAALVNEHYSKVQKHNITTKITDLIISQGMTLGSGIVREILRESNEHLPGGELGPDPAEIAVSIKEK